MDKTFDAQDLIDGLMTEKKQKALNDAKEKIMSHYGENKQIMDDRYDKSLAIKCKNGTFVGRKTDNVVAYKGIPYFPISGASFTPDKKVEEMGRDLSKECPVLIYERLSNGTYRARFETIRKGQIPVYEDGTPLKMEELTYKNMESDALPDASGTGDQVNEYALPLFEEASRMLFEEISPLFETQQNAHSDSQPDTQQGVQSESQQDIQSDPRKNAQFDSQQDFQPITHKEKEMRRETEDSFLSYC